RPGSSVLTVNLKDYTPAGHIPDLWYQVRKKIADMKGTLPQGIQGPAFNDEFGDTFGTVYAFTADGFSYRELKDFAESARAELMRVPDVGKIQFVGIQNEKIYLDFSTRQLAALGIDREQVVAELQAQNAVAPAGVVQAGDEKVTVRVSGEFTSEESLAAINLRSNGKFYRLADLAQVRRGYADPPSPIFRYRPAATSWILARASTSGCAGSKRTCRSASTLILSPISPSSSRSRSPASPKR
ncbi:MAG: family transporter, partial [Thermomicrobiales bacterium]|nr:family transporter [Thermomicrobiales bacterium]